MAMYPGFLLDDMEGHKTKAALWHSGTGSRRVVWVEDGFQETALAWARMDSRVTLISTLHASDPAQTGIHPWNIEAIKAALNLEFDFTLQADI
jgi:hypothetical protein